MTTDLRNRLSGEAAVAATQPRLIPSLCEALRVRRYSVKTEKAYVQWVRRYIYFHGKRHPREMGAFEVTAFLNHLANVRHVAASTQNQALAALLFLYRHVLDVELPWLEDMVRAKKAKRLPTILGRDEVQAVLARMTGTRRLMASLLYGSGLRLNECLCLRVQDVDLTGGRLMVREGKGMKDRVTLLPHSLQLPLRAHLNRVKALHNADLARGLGEAPLPQAVAARFPGAGQLWGWQFVFPSAQLCRDPLTGRRFRFHVSDKTLQRAVKAAGLAASIGSPVGCHTLRHALTGGNPRWMRLICWRTGTASESFRTCWAIKMWRRR